MAVIINDRDTLLQSAVRDVDPRAGKYIELDLDGLVFHQNGQGVVSPTVITITANPVNLSGTVEFSVSSGSLSGTGNTRTFSAAAMTGESVVVTATITQDGQTYTKAKVITKVVDGISGADGAAGPAGPKNHVAFLYKWATSTPAKPTGTATFTWASLVATSYAGSDGWTTSVPTNPGTPLVQLYVAQVGVTAAATAITTAVTFTASTVAAWAQNGANGTNGAAGAAGATGVQAGEALIYQWAATIPAGPVGTGAYVYATGAFGTVPTSWSATPGTSPSPGMTLWRARVAVSDSASVTSTSFNWNTAGIVAVGYAGSNGANGTNGVAAYVEVSTTGGQVFSRANSSAAYTPTSTTLSATPYGGTATYQWQYWSGSAWVDISGATVASYAVASGAFTTTRTYRVKATIEGVAYFDEVTLVQLTGGANGSNGVNAIVGLLTNESIALVASATGVVSSFANATGTFKVYDGATDKTGTATYSVASSSGCTVSITAAGVYTVSAMSVDQATATLQAVYGGVTIQKVLSLAKAKAGADGANGTNGSNGSNGAQGASYVTAYCASATASATAAPANTTGIASLPAANSGGITGTWSVSVPTLTAGQFMYQSDGIYNPMTNTVVWSIPYWSSLKVGTLSAITANLGAMTAGSIDIGSGASSWHVNAQGDQWVGADTLAAAPFSVTKAGRLVASSFEFKKPDGTVLMSAGGLTEAGAAPGTKNSDVLHTISYAGDALNLDPLIESLMQWDRSPSVSFSDGASGGAVTRNWLACTGGVDQFATDRQDYPIAYDRTYSLTGMLFANHGNNRNMYLWVDFLDAAGDWLPTTWGGSKSGYVFGAQPPAGDWSRQGARFGAGTDKPIPPAARTAVIGVWFQYSGGGSSAVMQGVQDLRLADVTAAQTAGASAASAQAQADLARQIASSVNDTVSAITADDWLSRDEKPSLILLWNTIYNEVNGVYYQADNLGLIAVRDSYWAAFSGLSNYLPYGWDDVAINTAINRFEWNSKFQGYSNAKQALMDAVAAELQARAQRAQTTASTISLSPDGTLNAPGGGKVTLPGMGQNTYRVVAHGNAAYATSPVAGGVYVNGAYYAGGERSYNLLAIQRSTGAIAHMQSYDVYGAGGAEALNNRTAAVLAGDLAWFATMPGAYILVLWTHDEPFSARLTSGLLEAMLSNGASRSVFGSSRFRTHSAYALVSLSGCGENNGAEAYQGDYDGDPRAWVDVAFTTVGGSITGVTGGHIPRTLQDYGYLGDMNATAGAPAGTLVAGVAAQTVADGAWYGASAYNALGGKLSKSGDVLGGIISVDAVASPAGFKAGTLTWDAAGVRTSGYGVAMTPKGIIGYNAAGSPTLLVDAQTGAATFGGELTAATGTFGGIRLASGGYICNGSYNGWNGPAAGAGGGFAIAAQGAVWGNYADGRYVAIYENGDISAPGFSLVNKQLTLTNAIIITPKINSNFAVSVPDVLSTGNGNGNVTIDITPLIYNGSGSYSYQWSFTAVGAPAQMYQSSAPGASFMSVYASGTNIVREGNGSVTIRDNSTGMISSATFWVRIQLGSGVIT